MTGRRSSDRPPGAAHPRAARACFPATVPARPCRRTGTPSPWRRRTPRAVLATRLSITSVSLTGRSTPRPILQHLEPGTDALGGPSGSSSARSYSMRSVTASSDDPGRRPAYDRRAGEHQAGSPSARTRVSATSRASPAAAAPGGAGSPRTAGCRVSSSAANPEPTISDPAPGRASRAGCRSRASSDPVGSRRQVSARCAVVELLVSRLTEESPDLSRSSSGSDRFGPWPVGRQGDERAAGDVLVDVLRRRAGGDDVVAHCMISVGTAHVLEVVAVVREERDPRELAGDRRVEAAEKLVSSSPSSGRPGLPMIIGAVAATSRDSWRRASRSGRRCPPARSHRRSRRR